MRTVIELMAALIMLGLLVALSRLRAASEAALAQYRQIVETAKEGVLTIAPDQAISLVNQQASDMLGYAVDEPVHPRISEFTGAASTGERETTLRRKDGTIMSVLLNESPLLDREGHYAGQLGMITDLTDRKILEDELAFQAVHDPLTGLPNRLLLVDRLQLALGRAKPGTPGIAVVLLGIDGFTDVNTAVGHRDGDQLLIEVGKRLASCIRERDTVARFGGDEFAVICDSAVVLDEGLADRLATAVAAPYSIGGSRVDITASMGIAIGQHGDRPGALLRGADMALLKAKANGRGRTEYFTEVLRSTSRQRLTLVADLRRAVVRREFSLRFQPVVSLVDGGIIGAEALIRWQHRRRGTLSPLEFIPVAEETGLIDPIGQWVIEETCAQLARWQQLMPELYMSLNISARQLTAGVLDEIVRDAIKTSGVEPSHLALEITEAVLMDDLDLSVRTLTALHKTGVTISMDDFGTGYSSLSYLDRFPIDALKIDQTFVAGLPHNAYDAALVQAVLTIADALDLSVIAEGVENEAQAKDLLRLGCTKGQGFYFYRPLTAEAFEAQLVAAGLVPSDSMRAAR